MTMQWFIDRMPKDWGRLPTLPTTQFKTLVGARLAYATAAFFFVCTFLGKLIDPVLFGLWLSFVGAWAALSVSQYKTKRETDAGYVAAKASGPNDPPPAPTTTTVTTAAVSTTSDRG